MTDVNYGGFLSQPTNNGSSQPQRTHDRTICCSVSELLNARQDEGENFIIRNAHLDVDLHLKLHYVVLCGVVRSASANSHYNEYALDDHSGATIDIQNYIRSGDEDEEENVDEKTELLPVGHYAQFVGNLRAFGQTKNFVAFSAKRVTNYNDVTVHRLQVLHDHQFLYHELKEQMKQQQENPNGGAGNNTSFNGSNAGGSSMMLGQDTHLSGLTNIQRQVQSTIRANQTDDGCHLDTIFSKLAHIDRPQLRAAIDFLNNEGHIYSTIDDNHFMTTD